MKLGKKLLSLLTVLCLTLSLFPTMAFAADDGRESAGTPANSVSVGNVTLNRDEYLLNGETSKTQTAPPSGTGYIHFTSDGTLELNGYTDENTNTRHQISGANLTIHLTGNNHINSANNGIYSAGTLTISGSGSLTLTPATHTTIYATDTITIQGGAKVTAACGEEGQSIHLNEDNKEIIITGSNTEVDASDSTNRNGEIRCGYSIYQNDTCNGVIRLNDGAKLTASKINGTLKINGQDGNRGDIGDVTASPTTYTVSGTVKNGTTLVAGASVQLCTTGTDATTSVIATSTTNSDGEYRLTGISEGSYTITVNKGGYTEVTENVTLRGNDKTLTKEITLTPINYNISVQGTPVTGANMNNVLGVTNANGTPTVTYEPNTNVLTLNGVAITNTSTSTSGIQASANLTIALIGENNTISGSGHAIYMTNGTLTITGPGSLNASSSSGQTTIYTQGSGDVIINGGAQITVKNTNSDVGDAIHLSGTTNKNLTITGNNTQVIAQKNGSATAINGVATLTVSDGATLTAQSNRTAISCTTLSRSDNDYIAEASVGYDGSNPGPYVPSNVSNYKCVHVYPKTASVKHYGVWIGSTELTSANNSISGVSYDPDTQTLTLNGAEITGAPNRQYTSKIKDACGIYSKHDLTIKLTDTNTVRGSTETQDNGSYGIFVSGKLTFTSDSNGSITVSGGTSSNSGNAWVPGVYASGITVKNCNVTAIGGTATSDSYPVAYAMSKAPTLVGAKVVKVNTETSEPATTVETYNSSRITRYQYLQIQKTNESDTTVAAPVITPEGGYFTGDPHVTISCPTDDATIYYTTDGTDPSSTNHADQITLSTTGKTTIKAIAVKEKKSSEVVTAEFTQRAAGEEVTKVALDVAVDTHNMTTKVGNTEKLTATVQYKKETTSGVTVTWESDNPEVATVADGVITAKSVGKARITAAVVENGVTYSDFCDVIVEARPSSSHHSSSSTTYYDVNAAVSGEGGSVAASTKRASRGTTVTVTATAASGYQVAQVSAVDKDGKAVSLTDKGDGVYTFVMPASKVDVTARFAQVQKPEEKDPYGDVSKDSYYYDAVKWAAETGVTTGVGDGLFAPEWVCTRGQIVTFLWRASGSPAPKATELPFTDVAADAYYAQAVLWAVEKGITNGTSETTFGPDQTCTRAHAVAFLYRMSGSPAAAGSTFSDVAADAYYSAAVAWAVEKGITNGTSGTTFSPDDTCTRGQIVTFLYRLAQTK